MAQRSEFEELDSMSVELAVQLDDTRKSADQLTTAFDLTTDTSIDVAKSQEKLTKAVDKETSAVNKSVNITNNNTDQKIAENDVSKKYKDALERRIEVETKLSEQRPIRRYSKTNPDAMEKVKQKESKPSEKDTPIPVELPETFDEFARRSIGSLDEMKETYIKTANKNHKTLTDGLNKLRIFKRMSTSDSATARIVGGAVSSSVDKLASLADSFMSQIPGYDMAKSATGFVAGHIGDTRRQRRESRAEKEATTEHGRQTNELRPVFERQQTTNTTSSVEKSEKESLIVKATDEKKERTQQKAERDKTDVRHRSLMSWLASFQTMMVAGKLMGLLASIGGSIGGAFTKLGTMLMPALKGLLGVGKMLLPAIAGITTLLGFMKSKLGGLFGGGKPQTPSQSTSSNQPRTTNAPSTPDAPDIDKDGKPKTGKTVDKKLPAKKGLMQKISGAGSKLLKSAGGGKAALKLGAKIGARAIPFVGTALLAYDLYQGANYLYEQYQESQAIAEAEKNQETMNGDVNITSTPSMELKANTDIKPSEQVDIHAKQEQQASKAAIQRTASQAAVSNQNVSTSVMANSKTTNIFPGGFGFNNDSYTPSLNYGAAAR